MSTLRPSRLVALVSVLVVSLSIAFPSTAATRPQSAKRVYVVVDIDRIGHERLTALKSLAGVDWWVELDDQMLVSGQPAMLENLDRAGFASRMLSGDIDAENLHLLYGRDAELSGARVLAQGGRFAVVHATPAQKARLEGIHDHDLDGESDVPHGHNEVHPFRPNVSLVHQAANSEARQPAAWDVAIQALVDAIDGNRWFADIQTLGQWNRHSRQPGNLTARDWLVAQFQAIPGLAVTTQSFNIPSPSTTSFNVIATLTGTTRPDEWYIVGGHFDSTSQSTSTAAPGCEDNGSGTAGVLEMARIFAAHPPEATIIFVCYSGEEQGLYGGTAHAASLVTSGDDDKVQAVLTMDMIGYTGDSDLDCLLETNSSGQFMIDAYAAAAAQYTTLRILTTLNPFGSDHVPYLNRGMPALLTIENDWDSYPNYHRTTDTANNITIDMGLQTLRMNVAALAKMIAAPPAGTGSDTIGVYDPSTSNFFLRNTNGAGAADVVFSFGAGGAGYLPLAGDWNGDGSDTIGLYDPVSGVFFLKNSVTPGGADLAFNFGPGGLGWKPVVGDWDGNGTDTVGLYSPSTGTFFLRNTNAPGGADVSFGYGPAGATPVVGDWDGNGADSIGVYIPATSTFFLRNGNSPGGADLVFSYGAGGAGFVPVVGDWNSDGADTVGLYQPTGGSFFLRNANSPGGASVVFGYGPPSGMVSVRGDWNNL
ncbi:MAG: M28 family peptidase [Blastocatellia bacterium]|jgi:hypothetical protein|nr:M28 family peptidase [Blastocatellia bacterium]